MAASSLQAPDLEPFPGQEGRDRLRVSRQYPARQVGRRVAFDPSSQIFEGEQHSDRGRDLRRRFQIAS